MVSLYVNACLIWWVQCYYFEGVTKITKTSDKYALSQSHCIEKILDKFIKDDMNVARTPVDISLYLSKHKGDAMSQLKYS